MLMHTCRGNLPQEDWHKFPLKGNQRPPGQTGYDIYSRLCGYPGEDRPSREKRSILRPPHHTGEDYIEGGENVTDFKYPWIGQIRIKIDGVWKKKCTFAMISSRHALTALHCFIESKIDFVYGKSVNYNKDDIYNMLFGRPDSWVVERTILKFHVPPKTVSGKGKGRVASEHDLVMLEFREIIPGGHVQPICLPLWGFPQYEGGLPSSAPRYTLAGYGAAGFKYIDGVWEPVDKGYLQEVTVRSGRNLVWQPPRKIMRNPPRVFEGYHREKNPRTAHFIMYIEALHGLPEQYSCAGDSGAPWMFQTNGRYILAGIHSNAVESCKNSPNRRQETVANKISTFTDWILKKMIVKGSHKACLQESCKPNLLVPNNATRTWIAKNFGDSNEEKLATPCHYVETKERENVIEKYYCAVVTDNDHSRIIDAQHVAKYTECVNCEKPDWKWTNYLDEITGGSLSLPKTYDGKEPVADRISELIPDTQNQLLFDDTCAISTWYDHVDPIECPLVDQSGRKKCILPESICDGHEDCEGGWDESPSLCIGKCDYWKQYQNNAHYDPVAKGHGSLTEKSTTSAAACHGECSTLSKCTHWDWFGTERKSGDKFNCKLHEGDVKYFIGTTFDQLHVTPMKNTERGVKACAYDPGQKREEIYSQAWRYVRTCIPTVGGPYRTGFYLIQAFNGMFVEVSKSDNYVWLSPSNLEWNAKKALEQGSSGNRAEWVFIFRPKVANMDNSTFTIYNSFGVNNLKPSKALTLSALDAKEFRTEPLDENLNASTDKKTQSWFLEIAGRGKGYTEVKIYTKLQLDDAVGIEHKYITISSEVTRHYQEYHTVFKGQTFDHQKYDDHDWLVNLESKITNEKEALRQTFRIFECDYGLNDIDGSPESKARNVTRHMGLLYDKASLKSQLVKIVGNPIHKRGEFVLREIFGISRSLITQKRLQKADEALLDTVSQVMSESGSLYDYAGRMRIYQSNFKLMFEHWSKIKHDWRGDQKNTYGRDLHEFVLKRLGTDNLFLYAWPGVSPA